MNQRSVTFARFVFDSLRAYRIGIPLLFALLVGVATAIAGVINFTQSVATIRTLGPHLSTLVETGDRPEMLRLLGSLAGNGREDFVIVQKGQILASSRSISELDQIFTLNSVFENAEFALTRSKIVAKIPIDRVNGPMASALLYVAFPLKPALLSWLTYLCIALGLGVLISWLLAVRITKVIRQVTRPIEEMDQSIQSLFDQDEHCLIQQTGILELDRTRLTLFETKLALNDATERLGLARAKELAAESYQRLIHDLYTPVAAMRESMKISADLSVDSELRDRSQHKISRLAEQILNQVSVAKEHLGHEPRVLDLSDVRNCVREAAEQARLAFAVCENIRMTSHLPTEPVIVPHDPENLRRAVSNLVSNALRASREIVEIEIEQNSSGVAIRVSDDGPGIEPSEVGLLLQGRSVSKENGRLSFGLPSANHIARMHGGRIVYRRSLLGGACFEIRI
jgi:signal transduction histidine kinase